MKAFISAYKVFIAFFSLIGIMLLSISTDTLWAQSQEVIDALENGSILKVALQNEKWTNTEKSPVMLGIVDHDSMNTDIRRLDEPVTYKDGKSRLERFINYPDHALWEGPEGYVSVSFIVEPNGSTSDIRVHHSLHPACDDEVIKAIQSAKFNPGLINGTPVRVRCFIPVQFVNATP